MEIEEAGYSNIRSAIQTQTHFFQLLLYQDRLAVDYLISRGLMLDETDANECVSFKILRKT